MHAMTDRRTIPYSLGTRTASMMWMMEAPALMFAMVTRAEPEAPWTLTVLPTVEKVRLCPVSRVGSVTEPVGGTSEAGWGAPRMWYWRTCGQQKWGAKCQPAAVSRLWSTNLP